MQPLLEILVGLCQCGSIRIRSLRKSKVVVNKVPVVASKVVVVKKAVTGMKFK
jgi:hypothetical protein